MAVIPYCKAAIDFASVIIFSYEKKIFENVTETIVSMATGDNLECTRAKQNKRKFTKMFLESYIADVKAILKKSLLPFITF